MKENSREEDIEKKIKNIQYVNIITLLRQFKKEGLKNFIVLRKSNFDEIISDYKRALKENKELKETNEDLQKSVDQIYDDYQDIGKMAFDYSDEIKQLQKENEELKNKLLDILEGKKVIEEETPKYIGENYIQVQKVKDKIEEYKKMLLSCNRFSDVDRIKAINERILELQELLEGRK